MTRAALVASLTGLIAIVLMCVTLTRAPLVWLDEVYIVSSSRALAAGGDGTPDITPPSAQSLPVPLVYGPVFFWLDGQLFSRFGVTPVTGRVLSLAGAIATGVAAAILVTTLSGSTAWGLIAFGTVLLLPEIGSSASNGRMDTLAVAFELFGMSAFIWGAGRWPRAIPGGLIAGAFWAAAVMTTERAFTFGLAVAIVALVALVIGKPFERRPLVVCSVVCGVLVLSASALWAHHWDVTLLDWVRRIVTANRTRTMSAVGNKREWAASLANTLSSILLVPMLALVLAAARRVRAVETQQTWFVLTIGLASVALSLATVNMFFLRSIYFVVLPAVAVIAVCARLTPSRYVFQFGVVCFVVLAGMRAVKTLDVVESWDARSPRTFDRLIGDNVRPGSVVVGYHEFYFYTIGRYGSTFRSEDPAPWAFELGSTLETWADRIHRPAPKMPQADFLIWPDDPHYPMPERVKCAAAFPIARYDAPSAATALDRLPVFGGLAYLRRYPSTVLYRVPGGCSI